MMFILLITPPIGRIVNVEIEKQTLRNLLIQLFSRCKSQRKFSFLFFRSIEKKVIYFAHRSQSRKKCCQIPRPFFRIVHH